MSRRSEEGIEVEYPKIPIPPARLWRELRVRALPVVVFLVTAGVVARLWSERAQRAYMTGVVVGAQAEVRTPVAGILTDLRRRRFEHVEAGEVLAQVVTTDLALLEARLAVVRARMAMVERGMGPMEDLQRNLMNRLSLEADVVRERIALSAAAINRDRLEREYERAARLYEEQVITEEELDRIRAELEIAQLEVAEGTALLAELERRLEEFREQFELRRGVDGPPSQGRTLQRSSPGGSVSDGPVAAALRLHEEELRLIEAEATPVQLTAPISGMISEVFHEDGAALTAGEPILVIRSEQPEYVVGYLPHPLRLEPRKGMEVVVRTQGSRPRQYEGRIIRVGAQLEDMSAAQHLVTNFIRMALPVQIAVAGDVSLRPGEIVNVMIKGDPDDG